MQRGMGINKSNYHSSLRRGGVRSVRPCVNPCIVLPLKVAWFANRSPLDSRRRRALLREISPTLGELKKRGTSFPPVPLPFDLVRFTGYRTTAPRADDPSALLRTKAPRFRSRGARPAGR
jgi:hypothetical protein